jgi:DNA-binding IclR family transcriptional regulator
VGLVPEHRRVMTETARPPRATGAGADPDADDASLGAISKGLRILEVLAHDGPILGLSEIARRAEIAKTTTLRALVSLQDGGYVERSGKKYRLSWRVLGLNRGAPFCEPGGLLDVALPHLSELHQTSGLSVSLGVLDGDHVRYLARIHRAGSFRLPGGTGARVPATCTALGKAILAFQPPGVVDEIARQGLPVLTSRSLTSAKVLGEQLTTIRTHGLAHDREEAALGVVCLAAPVLHRGRAVAAISVSGRAERLLARPLDGLLRKVAASAASDYASAIGGRRLPGL